MSCAALASCHIPANPLAPSLCLPAHPKPLVLYSTALAAAPRVPRAAATAVPARPAAPLSVPFCPTAQCRGVWAYCLYQPRLFSVVGPRCSHSLLVACTSDPVTPLQLAQAVQPHVFERSVRPPTPPNSCCKMHTVRSRALVLVWFVVAALTAVKSVLKARVGACWHALIGSGSPIAVRSEWRSAAAAFIRRHGRLPLGHLPFCGLI